MAETVQKGELGIPFQRYWGPKPQCWGQGLAGEVFTQNLRAH